MSRFTRRGNDPKIERLKRASVFATCSSKELRYLSSLMDDVELQAGRVLTTEGQPGHTFYVLVEGEVEASIRGTEVAKLGAGDFFGEISMLDRRLATATVTSTTPVRLLVMSHAQFRDAVHSDDAVLAEIVRAMETRLRANSGAVP